MSYKHFLKLFSSANHNHSCFSLLHLNCLTNRFRIIPLTNIRFYTVNLENSEDKKNPYFYYRDYFNKNLDSYTHVRDVIQMSVEVNRNPHTFKLLNDFLNNSEGDINQQLKDITSEFSICDVNEICKRIIFMNTFADKHSKSNNIIKLIECLNKELHIRKYSCEETLMIMLAIYFSKFKNKFYFAKKGMLKLFRKINRLSRQQLVQCFLGIPKISVEDYKFSVFSCLSNNISKLNADELGIITRGMLKCNLIFCHENICIAILTKLLEEIKNIHSVPLQDTCKALQKLNGYFCRDKILEFQEKLIPHVSKLNPEDLIELASLGIQQQTLNSSFWEVAVEKIRNNMNNLKLPSILSLINCMHSFSIEDKELLMLGLKEFEKCEDIKRNYKIITYFLSKLVHNRLYSKNLLEVVLSEKFFLEEVYPLTRIHFKLMFSWWTLYCNVEIEKPEYLNFTLDVKKRKKLYHIIQGLFFTENKGYVNKSFSQGNTSLCKTLTNMYGENTAIKCVCLPHYEPGVVFKFNKNMEVQPIPDFFSSEKSYVKKPLDDDYWIFMSVLNFNQYNNNSNEIHVHRQTQYRQLQAFGYIPILILKHEYWMHSKQNTEKEFLTNLIQKSLEEKKVAEISSN